MSADEKRSLIEWTKHPATIIAVILTLATHFGMIVWFTATLNSRVDKIEAQQQSLQQRYEREVIPRIDLSQRLDRIDQSLDRIMDSLLVHEQKTQRP